MRSTTSRPLRRAGAAAITACAVLLGASLLAGCGEEAAQGGGPNGLAELEAVPAFQQGAADTLEAPNVVVEGVLNVEGEPSAITSRIGETSAEATVELEGTPVQIVRDGTRLYVKATPDYWKSKVGTVNANRIGELWATSTVDGPLSAFVTFVELDSLLAASGRITNEGATTLDGEATVLIVDPPTNTDSSWWFAAEGPALLLAYTSGENSDVTLRYDEVVLVDPPAAEESVDVSAIEIPRSLSSPSPTAGP